MGATSLMRAGVEEVVAAFDESASIPPCVRRPCRGMRGGIARASGGSLSSRRPSLKADEL